jgi:predicted nuclease of predicted toxin-antitoxin system
VWTYAREHGLTICSKDADFHQRSFLYGHPPKVVWIRRGNCSTREIEALLRASASILAEFERSEQDSFLALE